MDNLHIDRLWNSIETVLREDGSRDLFVGVYHDLFRQFMRSRTSYIPENSLAEPGSFPTLDQLTTYRNLGRALRPKAVCIKLNGGLGTTMGLTGPKGLLEVREKLSLLSMACYQSFCARVPLLLMNSYRTEKATGEHLASCLDESGVPLPGGFLQNRAPRLDADTGFPLGRDYGEDRWCPPGHGDLYTALHATGALQHLLDHGYRYAFVSNIDNCGATFCDEILGLLASKKMPFLMEVTERTPADAKGGHICRRSSDGQLMLRERAQVSQEDTNDFLDIEKHRLFNSNNLWLDLRVLAKQRKLAASLPLIVNEKFVGDSGGKSQRVIQLETAMGAALAELKSASAIEVPRTRFAPIKHLADWISVQSDQYRLTEQYLLERTNKHQLCSILLDESINSVEDIKKMFPDQLPSLRRCQQVEFTGRVTAWSDSTLLGDLRL